MKKLIYNNCFFYIFSKNNIKIAKIMIINYKYFIFLYFLKFNKI